MSAEPRDLDFIERPQELGLPPEAERVLEALTEHGAPVFSRDITRAIFQAQATGNLRPVRDVVEAWYRTLLLKSHPDYKDAVRWARDENPVDTFENPQDLVSRYR
jgi:hypothetical protein